jgi:mannose-1-phosphate guanylyltransferase
MALITPVILSGGAGTRLWPMSRAEQPKQFLALTGPQTMFEMTLARVHDKDRFAPPIVVAGVGHADLVEAQLGGTLATVLLEPCARNTAPAIALAALAAKDPATPLLVMPSDHVITDIDAFYRATDALLPLVAQGWLATYGIAPTGPETGYGYIQRGPAIAPGVDQVARFVEKPDSARAAAMIASGDHLWNGGIFMFRADTYLGILAEHAPDMRAAAQAAMDQAVTDGQRLYPDAVAFAGSPSDSIDYAVMEKADRVAVVPVAMGWSDVGSWDALYDIGDQDDLRGRGAENALAIETDGTLIRSDGIRIHTVGVSDLIVIASGNDVLIVPRGKSQDVKKIVDALRARQG